MRKIEDIFRPMDDGQIRRTIRSNQLQQIVPLSRTTIYELERKGDFPKRFNLTARCIVWDYDEVLQWLEARRKSPHEKGKGPDVRKRKTRPVKV